MAEEQFIVAVDVGGTLTKIAYADPTGSLTGSARLRTHLADGGAGLVPWLAATIKRWVEQRPGARCLGYGVVVPGIVDAASGTVRAAPNVDWVDVPLRDLLTELTGLPGVVAHDVRSAGLAEWRLGTGVGADNLLFLSIGTGIAGAMVVDDRMLDAGGYAGEIGHTRVTAAGDVRCACGQVGCLETLASAAGVARTYARLAGTADSANLAGTADLAGSAERIGADRVADLARSGDPSAQRAFDLAIAALTEALINYVTLLGPELIVIGGGLSGAADLFVPQLADAMAMTMSFQRLPRIVTAVLGADAGVIGAGLVGWDRLVDGAAS
jgi:glucokinase